MRWASDLHSTYLWAFARILSLPAGEPVRVVLMHSQIRVDGLKCDDFYNS